MNNITYPCQQSLTASEIYVGSMVGTMRRVSTAQEAGKFANTANVKDSELWGIDIDGALAEMAAAKAIGCYWTPSVNVGKSADVGGIQIRHTIYRSGHLVIRPKDEKREIYMLVTGMSPTFTLRGWIWLRDAKDPSFHRPKDDSGGECWWVPQSALIVSALPDPRSSNGRTAAFEAVNEGSSPSLGTN